ncbi:MAG: hypothetical protein HIU91_12080 [Acidobacteria bacterium]|nr:hypothetical protein [Acidobacteriota bacterium]
MSHTIGDKDRFWNKSIPLRPFLFITIAIVAPLYVWATAGERVSDWIWFVQHHGNATYDGRLIKLPFPWRQEDTPAGLHELSIRRASRSFGLIDEDMMITKQRVSPADVGDRIGRFRDLMLRFSNQTTVETYHPDSFIDANYACIVSRAPFPSDVSLYCVSNDGQWNMWLRWGKEASLADATTLLHTLLLPPKAS